VQLAQCRQNRARVIRRLPERLEFIAGHLSPLTKCYGYTLRPALTRRPFPAGFAALDMIKARGPVGLGLLCARAGLAGCPGRPRADPVNHACSAVLSGG